MQSRGLFYIGMFRRMVPVNTLMAGFQALGASIIGEVGSLMYFIQMVQGSGEAKHLVTWTCMFCKHLLTVAS